MKQRCYNEKVDNYPYYGGRGIRVCDRWLTSFESFYADLGPKPAGHSLDRIDPDGLYSPENCRWVDGYEQARNRRWRRTLTYNGESLSLDEWAARTGIARLTLYMRIKAGWEPEKVLTTAIHETTRRRARLENGQYLSRH